MARPTNGNPMARWPARIRSSRGPWPAPCRSPRRNDASEDFIMNLRWLDLVVIALYFAGVAWIGFRFARRQNSTEAYFVARRSVPHWAMGLSIFATIISSITFIAYPGAAYKDNWNQLVPGFMAIGVLLVLGTMLISFFRRTVGMSAYEYFEKRFGYGARAYSALAFTAGHFSKMGFVLFTITTAS